jgi:electron transport complex protein RnfB
MDVYETLRSILDKHLNGCPPAPEIIEILKILYTKEEAEVAIGLSFAPFSIDVISRRTGVEPAEVERRLDSLTLKGVVACRPKEGNKRYSLFATLPGFFEFPFMIKRERTPELDRLAELWHNYMDKLSQTFGSPETSTVRVLPIQEEVPNEPSVLPYEKIYDMIDKAEVVGIANCACRQAEHNCDAPIEACMLFDGAAVGLSLMGIGRIITKEEMKKILKECDDYGLIHQVNNAQERLTMLCNCCSCCCVLLRSFKKYGNPNVISSSGFMPQCNEEICSGCGICAEERCKMDAITIENDLPVINENLCIGCGLCVTGCPEEAMKLVRREKVRETPPTDREMAYKILRDKGKFEDFMELNNPDITPDYLKG